METFPASDPIAVSDPIVRPEPVEDESASGPRGKVER